MIHNFKVQRLNGTTYDMNELGIIVNRLIVESPSPIHYREKIEGRDGYVDQGTEYDGRNANATLTLIAIDNIDYTLYRDEVFRIFDSREAFYLLPDESPGKRILAKYNSPYSLARQGNTGEFNISFSSESAYFESIGTTLDPKTFDTELWQTGQGLTLDETMYTHSTASFQIYNAADGVTINPRQMPLEITFKGASSNLKITNATTGDVWQYTKTTASGDTLKLTGVRSLKNGLSVFSDTNHKLITLAPGYNNFTITGATGSFTISFSFRFYTL
ncbi:phage tail family protein [Robertmurraya korlensis]|uniref:phage tail family protein n=1 Tax=Robertmurraya korlensis TaxID=519977 RepID=UPI00203B4459|nr:phage tail family protein [Robertmurraya korlensis]MCM3600626.1 phage tail family protein [Robertmurraya korlensis]